MRTALTTVWCETDYSVFRELENNRDVKSSRFGKLVASFSEGEILNPIIVNEKMEIVDGQGRFEAKKSLGLPIYYVVSPGATIEDCRRMNAYNKSWTHNDFIDSFANSGNPNYLRLVEIIKATHLNLTQIGFFMNGTFHTYENGRSEFGKLMNGTLIFSESDYRNVLDAHEKINEIVNALEMQSKPNTTFYNSTSVMLKTDKYSHSRFVRNCSKYKMRFTPMLNLEDQLKEFSVIYNLGAKKDDRLYFEDYMRNRGHNVRSYENNTFTFQGKSVKTLGGNNGKD